MPEFMIGDDVICIDDSPFRATGNSTGLKKYAVYRVTGYTSSGLTLFGVLDEKPHNSLAVDRFINVSDWPEADKTINRA